jgi:phosphoglycolate phosphatase
MKLVVFDCDGTLADSQHAIVRAMTETFVKEGLDPPPRARVLSVVGLSTLEAMVRLVPGLSLPIARRLAERYRSVAAALRRRPEHGEPLFPGACDALRRLAQRGDLLLGLATGKSRAAVDQLIEREGLHDLFATIQTADANPSKPHPAMLFQAMHEAGVTAPETVMVGDSTFDVEMARAARVATIGVSWGYHDELALTAAGAAAIIRDFAELEPEIDRALAGLAQTS